MDTNRYSPGNSATVLDNTGSLVKTGYAFAGWNTKADGSGTFYSPGATATIGSTCILLYAVWSVPHSVTYDGNGATGGTVPVDANQYLCGQSVTVLGNTGGLVNGSLYFQGWNTEPDGSGISYTPGVTFSMGDADVTLYAVWIVDPFASATNPGDVVAITVGSETVNMIYANNQAGIIFPFSPTSGAPVDNNPATLTRKFFMSGTLVTNAVMAEVLQWAKDNNKIVEAAGHNQVSAATVKYGTQELIDLDYSATDMKISYSTSTHKFSVASGYEDHPVVLVSWYGAVMFCNWLTEMRDGNTANVVYTGIDTTWVDTETVEDTAKNGYRLPSTEEWEYSARYIGTTAPTGGNLVTEYVAQGVNSGHATLTAGYYWTPGDYVSGAIKDNTNAAETRTVAWYSGDPAMGGSDKLMPVAQKTANKLGLYDMSGNVLEWCLFHCERVSPRVSGRPLGRFCLPSASWLLDQLRPVRRAQLHRLPLCEDSVKAMNND